MFSTILKEVTGILDRRFLMNLFFPSLTFWGLLIVVWFSGKGNLTEAVRVWNKQEMNLLVIQAVGFLVWVTLFAQVLDSQLTAILKLHEGYWDFPIGRFFRALGRERHWERLARLGKEAKTNPRSRRSRRSYEEIYLSYPLPTQRQSVMPTRLGNIIKSAELYPTDRYNIDTVLIWPRLYDLFPEKLINLISGIRAALDFMLVISSLGIAFAIVSGAYLLVIRADWWLFLICFWGGMLVARIAYHGATSNALLFAEQIKVAFDLYREELLKQMRIPLPGTRDEEDETWGSLCEFIYRNVPPNYIYSAPDPSRPSKRGDHVI